MIYLIYTPNSLSCNKAIKFFKKNNIEIKKINPFTTNLNEKMLYDILYLTYNGFNDILNLNHKSLVDNKIDINKFNLKQIIHFIIHEPGILKKPIIIEYVNNKPYKLMVGFNNSEINIFLRS